MGCMSARRMEVRPEAKWEYITLNDFKSTSCLTPFAYCYLWFSLFLSIAVYGVDGFTAVNLLVFGKWSSAIEPSQLIPFDVAKWIFAICIILSIVNLLYEHIRANRVMRRGSVAECYLNNLAARLESIRFGSGRGFKRFLVFAELTKSKKGAEYVALFTYFSFQSWIRVLVCSGPRQAVNGFTLYSVYTAKLSIEGQDFGSSLSNFFSKIQALGLRESFILSGMVFTLVIWVFSFLSLLLAGFFFVFFLWHYIPRGDGGLSGYCERKATKRLMQIVSHKINKAMEDEEKKRRKAELRAAKKTGEVRPISMKATLPDVGDEKLHEMPKLNRTDTMGTLPQYSTRPGSPGSIELGTMDRRRPVPSRTGTMASGVSSAPSYSSRQGLLGAAAQPGVSRPESPTPTLPPIDLSNFPPPRSATAASNRNYGPGQQLNRAPTNASGFGGSFTASPGTYSAETMPPLPPPGRSATAGPGDYRGPTPFSMNQQGQDYRRPTYESDYGSARGTPAPYPMDRRPTQTPGQQPYDDFSSARGTPAPYPMDRQPMQDSRRQPFDEFASARGSPAPYPMDAPYPPDGRRPQDARRPTYDDYSSQQSQAPYPADDGQAQNAGRPTFDQYSSGRASPAPTLTSNYTGPLSPRDLTPGAHPARSFTNPMPRGPGSQLTPIQRVATAPIQSSQHQPTFGDGPLRSPPPTNPRPFHQPTFSNNSLRDREPTLPQLEPTLPQMEPTLPQMEPTLPQLEPTLPQLEPTLPRLEPQFSGSSDHDYFSRPSTSNSQRPRPGGPAYGNGNGNGNGWNQDVERGQRARY